MEEHGYWNDQMKRFVHEVSSINTEDGITYENARAQYESAKWDLTQKGFVHSFVQEYRRKDPREYTVPELEPMTV